MQGCDWPLHRYWRPTLYVIFDALSRFFQRIPKYLKNTKVYFHNIIEQFQSKLKGLFFVHSCIFYCKVLGRFVLAERSCYSINPLNQVRLSLNKVSFYTENSFRHSSDFTKAKQNASRTYHEQATQKPVTTQIQKSIFAYSAAPK